MAEGYSARVLTEPRRQVPRLLDGIGPRRGRGDGVRADGVRPVASGAENDRQDDARRSSKHERGRGGQPTPC